MSSRPKPNAPNTRAWTAPLASLTPSARTTAWTRPLGPVVSVPARGRRVVCSHCGKTVGIHNRSGRISRHNDPRGITCPPVNIGPPSLPSIDAAATLWGGVVGRA